MRSSHLVEKLTRHPGGKGAAGIDSLPWTGAAGCWVSGYMDGLHAGKEDFRAIFWKLTFIRWDICIVEPLVLSHCHCTLQTATASWTTVSKNSYSKRLLNLRVNGGWVYTIVLAYSIYNHSHCRWRGSCRQIPSWLWRSGNELVRYLWVFASPLSIVLLLWMSYYYTGVRVWATFIHCTLCTCMSYC